MKYTRVALQTSWGWSDVVFREQQFLEKDFDMEEAGGVMYVTRKSDGRVSAFSPGTWAGVPVSVPGEKRGPGRPKKGE